MNKKKTAVIAFIVLILIIVTGVVIFIIWNKTGYSLYEEQIDYIELYENGEVAGHVENIHDFMKIYRNSIHVRKQKYIPDEIMDKFVRIELEDGSQVTITQSGNVIGQDGTVYKADIDFDAIWKLGC